MPKPGNTDECLDFFELHGLYGCGIGWSDVQLLVSVRLSGDLLWSLDARLAATTAELGVAYD